MKQTQESKGPPPIFIGRWTPKILFCLKENLIDTGSCVRHSEASRSICLPELFAIRIAGLIPGEWRTRSYRCRIFADPARTTIIAPLGGMCRWQNDTSGCERRGTRSEWGVR